MTAPLVFIDTETTGLHSYREAWEVAMIRRDTNGVERTEVFFIKLADLNMAGADPMALKIGRFYDRHPHYARDNGVGKPSLLSAAEAASCIAEFTRGAHLVGAVPSFDAETLDRLLRNYNQLPAWHYHLINVEDLAIGYIRGWMDANPDVGLFHYDLVDLREAIGPPWKSEELGRILGVDHDEDTRHTALGDAQWVKRMYDRCHGHYA